MTVALLYGGRSAEHEVSLVSAAAVFAAIEEIGVACEPIGVTRDGRWYHQAVTRQRENAREGRLTVEVDSRAAVFARPADGLVRADGGSLAVDCVFPLIHGTQGEDGTLQGLLEIAGLPYVGSGVVGSAVGMDKVRAKRLWERAGLPVVPYLVASASELGGPDGIASLGDRIESSFGFPAFVKPNRAGSSVGISRIASREELAAAVVLALEFDEVVLVEEALTVREIETSLIGNVEVVVFPPGEVTPTHVFYDYEAKYVDPDGAHFRIPADLPDVVQQQVMEIARAAYLAVDAAGFARVDCFVTRDTNEVFINEINTIPGFTPISMFPKMVEAGGVPFGELVGRLLELALARGAADRGRVFRAR